MAPSHLLLTPLPNWRGVETEIGEGLEIRRLAEPESCAAAAAEHAEFWLCYQFDNPHPDDSARHRKCRETAFRYLLYAFYAVQIAAPCGGTGILLLLRRDSQALTLESTERRQPFLPTAWGTRSVIPATFAADCRVLVERVLEAFYKPDIRLQIPIWLLEQGMAAPDPHIRILLCATGLDSLTKSSGQAVFKERLSALLGAGTLIFSPDEAGRQPGYRVSDVAGHLYQLRNEMAHGLPFSATFHKKLGFLDVDGQPVLPEFARYRYDRVLEECAVFLLCRTLREVLLSRLIFDIHMMEWRGAGSD
jgi:hypothetical protein